MKTTAYLTRSLLHPSQGNQPEPSALPEALRPIRAQGPAQKEELRHILLGSPDAIQQTIHLLYRLNYAEPGLWSPTVAIAGPLIITTAQGEAISLLRRSL